ncbi:MAG: CHRD domain-containing protein [Planctomycetota bacterium]
MKLHFPISAALVLAAGLVQPAAAQKLCFRADLDGGEQTPPNSSTATGTAWGIMDRVANRLDCDVRFTGIAPGPYAVHIHGMAPPGVGGVPPIHALPLDSQGPSVWNYSELQEADIIAGLTYWNVHSQLYVPGEIRGQFTLVGDAVFMVITLNGAQMVPSVTTTASGAGCVAIDTTSNTAVFTLDAGGYSGTEIQASVRGFAPAGGTGPVLFSFLPGDHKVEVWNYAEPDEAQLLAGLAYVEITSSGFPQGELRGQILPGSANPEVYCTAKLNSCGTSPAMLFLGSSSASATSGFRVGTINTRAQKPGLLLYSSAGPAATPFSGGTLCLATPLKRGPVKSDVNGTPGQCNGALSMDLNEFAAGLGGGSPAAFLSAVGTPITIQWWGRDTVAQGALLSNALSYVVGP